MQDLYAALSPIDRARGLTGMQEKTIRSQKDESMKLTPGVYEMLAYLVHHKAQLSEWEQHFVSNMQYWLKVRKKEPDQVQLMLLTVIYNRLKKSD